MSKYDLGVSTSKVSKIEKNKLYMDTTKFKSVEKNINKELEAIRSSLFNINTILNKASKLEIVKGKREEIFKGWAKVSKSQANVTLKLKENYHEKYIDDLQQYILKMLDERISDIENRLNKISNN